MNKSIGILIILLFLANTIFSQLIPRRTDQYPEDFGYYAIPIPYSIAGVGSGLGISVGANNILKTADALIFLIEGDIKAQGLGLLELQLFTPHILVDYFRFQSSKSSLTAYNGRGINTDKDDFSSVVFADAVISLSRFILTFDQRRFNLFYYGYSGSSKFDSILDKDGNEIPTPLNQKDQSSSFTSSSYGLSIDYTDEQNDPREGIRFDMLVQPDNGGDATDDVQFDVIDTNLTFYIPVFDFSTLVINGFDSNATVTRQGVTDEAKLRAKSFFNCTGLSGSEKAQCEKELEKDISNTRLANRYGTASSLGGVSRLRSYPNGRFSGAHTQFYGVELRWNLTNEKTPFDLFLFKDQRLGYQIAFFYEQGTVAEKSEDLWKESRSSYGVGFRFLTASGFTYRFDVANGEEGSNVALFFGFPWSAVRN